MAMNNQANLINQIRSAPNSEAALVNAGVYLSTVDPRAAREINALPPAQRRQASPARPAATAAKMVAGAVAG